MTIFLQKSMNADPASVIAVFGVTSITAPVAGVIVGGLVTDKMGGYKGTDGIKTTLTFCCFAAAGAAFCATLCSFLPKLIFPPSYDEPPGNAAGVALTVGLIALVLFFGGMIIPAANGVVVSCVARAFALLSRWRRACACACARARALLSR